MEREWSGQGGRTGAHEEGHAEARGEHAVAQLVQRGRVERQRAHHQHVEHHAQALHSRHTHTRCFRHALTSGFTRTPTPSQASEYEFSHYD